MRKIFTILTLTSLLFTAGASAQVSVDDVSTKSKHNGFETDMKKQEVDANYVEDAKKRAEKEVDDIIKDFNAEIDKSFSEKEAEIMKI